MEIHDYITCDGVIGYLSIKVIPNSGKTELVGSLGDHLKIRIAARPENKKVNNELIRFLAQELSIKTHQIEIISGVSSQIKIVKIKF